METDEPTVATWTVDAVLQAASYKALENRDLFSSVAKSLFCGEQDVVADRDRAFLQQMLRQVVFEIAMDLHKYLLVVAAEHDADAPTLKELSAERSVQVFDFLIATGLLSSSGIIQEAIMRLCIFSTEQALHGSGYAHVPGFSAKSATNLCELLGIPGSSQLGLRLTKRDADGLSDEDAFNNPLLCIKEIASDVKNQLIWYVAAALRHLIADQTEIAIAPIDSFIEQAASEVMVNTDSDVHSASDAVAKMLHEAGYLDSMALSAIFRNGDFRLFEAAIVQLTDVDIRLIRRLIFETGGLSLAVLSREVGLSIDDALYIFQVTGVSSQRIFPESVGKTIEFQEILSGISVDVASAVFAHWKRGRKFQSAIWDVKTAVNLLAFEG
jgi:hypothetical protein